MAHPIDYGTILATLNENHVDFTLIGGFAAVAHGVVRVTMDLDLALVLSSQNLDRAWYAMTQLGFTPRQPIQKSDFLSPQTLLQLAKEKNMKAVSFYKPDQPYLVVDFLFEDEFQLKNSERITLPLFGIQCPVITVEALIRLKQQAARPKDLEDIRELKRLAKKN